MTTAPAATAPTTPYHLIGGSDAVRALVDRFYDAMDQNPAYAELRALHAADLTPMRASLSSFLNGWLGGPRDWFAGGRCVMSAHGAISINAVTAAQWMAAMRTALDGGNLTASLRAAIDEAFARMAHGMAR